MAVKSIIKEGINLFSNCLKKTELTTKIGETEICSIFRGNRHIGSKVKYPNGITSETSITNRFSLTQEGEFVPMRVYKTVTKMPDGKQIVEKNKLLKVGTNVEVKSTTTTSVSSSRHIKQPEKQTTHVTTPEVQTAEEVKTVIPSAEMKETSPIKELVKQSSKTSNSKHTFLGISNDKDVTNWALAITYLGLIPAGVGLFLLATSKGPKTNYDFSYTTTSKKSTQTPEVKQKTGVKQELIEYAPKRGENWISILKAKYGVDDVTAKAMAHRIKDMCYDDSLAAKQAPIMYLPKVWNFNGKTYQYSDSIDVDKCKEFSDKVKTEMGKMSKDLQY